MPIEPNASTLAEDFPGLLAPYLLFKDWSLTGLCNLGAYPLLIDWSLDGLFSLGAYPLLIDWSFYGLPALFRPPG